MEAHVPKLAEKHVLLHVEVVQDALSIVVPDVVPDVLHVLINV